MGGQPSAPSTRWCFTQNQKSLMALKLHSLHVTSVAPATISPRRVVPATIARPEYVDKPAPAPFTGSEVKDSETIEKMRVAGRLAARARELVGSHVEPGVTTDELDRIGHEFLCDHGAYPSTLGYRGFPKSLCSSVNEVICHGIPDGRRVEDGDIVNIDITAFLDGVHGDTNATFLAGDVDEESRLLVERTREAMERGIKAVRPGRRINVIGRVIESFAKRYDYGVVRDFTGHGIGTAFHSGLIIPHYDEPAYNDVMEVGMTFTIEPMLNLGAHDWEMWDDGWTVVTRDGRRSAQFEHTLVVTATGAEVLTHP
jgi:methionyl aminopeptidase